MQDIPDSKQIFRSEKSEKLKDIPLTKEMVKHETDKLNYLRPDEICPRVLSECKEVVCDLL